MDNENLQNQSSIQADTQLNAKPIAESTSGIGLDNTKTPKSKKFRFRFKKSMIIVLLIIIMAGVFAIRSYSKSQKAKIKEVSTAAIKKGPLTQSVTLTGSIESSGRNEIALSPSLKVIEIFVKEGQTVKKGDILARLDDSDFRSQLQKQKLNLSNAEYNLNYIVENSSSSDKLTSENALKQAQISLENAKVNLDDVNKKFEQSKNLFEGGYISANEFEAAKKTVKDNQNAVKSAEIAMANAQSTYSTMDSTINNKIINQKNQIELIQSEIESLNKKIEDCGLRANVDGIVTKIDAKVNQYPEAGEKIIIDDISLYKASMDVSQHDAIKMKKGQKAIINVNGGDKKYTGAVIDIGQRAEKKLNSTDQDSKVNVKVSINKPDTNVKIGYEVDTEIILNEKKDVLQIGFEAIKEDAGKKYVFVIGDNNTISRRYVTTGLETDYNIEVLSGLKEGEKYVLSPEKTLKEGDKVSESGGNK
ncbi:MAG: efflux RND transporter periplasmic adaptor subunit [Clostridium lundense]|nr:efflux RND transporter periplasmic adaptor subunit [Clostridium lundense]